MTVDAKRKREERAADKTELAAIRAGHDRCLCGHERGRHNLLERECLRRACGCQKFRQDARYAR